jgi:hypothetical protein
MAVRIVLANIGVRVVYGGLTRSIKRRSQAWAKG